MEQLGLLLYIASICLLTYAIVSYWRKSVKAVAARRKLLDENSPASHTPAPGAGPELKGCPMCVTATLVWKDCNGHLRQACTTCSFVHWNNPIPVAVILIPKNGGLVLIERKFEPRADNWALPGGFVDELEDPAQAAVREAFEETGLTIELEGSLPVATFRAPGKNQILFFYQAKEATGQEKAGDDAKNIGVFTRETLPADMAFESHYRQMLSYFDRTEGK